MNLRSAAGLCSIADNRCNATMTPSIARSAPLLSAAPNERFSWHGEENFADQLLSTVRFQFGGHEEKTAAKNGSA